MTKSKVLAIYSDERLTLTGDMATEHLIIHLGTPGGSVECCGFRFEFDSIELIGTGSFKIRNGGRLVRGIERTDSGTTLSNGS